MDIDRYVGSLGVRLATLFFLLLCVAGAMLDKRSFSPGAERVILIIAIGSGFFSFIGAIHAFKKTYVLWLKVAKTLHATVVTLLFGACYVLVVPLFFLMIWLFDPLRVRKRSEPDTFWITRRSPNCDTESLRRVG